MNDIGDLFPVSLLQDRYSGTYSGGRWLAIANASELVGAVDTRVQFCLAHNNGPYSDDLSASRFWANAPKWIAVGSTPNLAVQALKARMAA